MWRLDELAEGVAGSLAGAAREMDLEQAVYGLDSWDEVRLHPLIGQGVAGLGFGVFREQVYPSAAKSAPKRSERARCDLVVTSSPALAPADPVSERLEREAARGTLFAHLAEQSPQIGAGGEAGDGARCPPEEAMWIEVKAIGQFEFLAGVPGPNAGYAGSLRAASADLRKLTQEPRIETGALLLVLFTADSRVAEHDLVAFVHHCLDRGLAVGEPVHTSFPIADRIGNNACTVGMVPIRGGAG